MEAYPETGGGGGTGAATGYTGTLEERIFGFGAGVLATRPSTEVYFNDFNELFAAVHDDGTGKTPIIAKADPSLSGQVMPLTQNITLTNGMWLRFDEAPGLEMPHGRTPNEVCGFIVQSGNVVYGGKLLHGHTTGNGATAIQMREGSDSYVGFCEVHGSRDDSFAFGQGNAGTCENATFAYCKTVNGDKGFLTNGKNNGPCRNLTIAGQNLIGNPTRNFRWQAVDNLHVFNLRVEDGGTGIDGFITSPPAQIVNRARMENCKYISMSGYVLYIGDATDQGEHYLHEGNNDFLGASNIGTSPLLPLSDPNTPVIPYDYSFMVPLNDVDSHVDAFAGVAGL